MTFEQWQRTGKNDTLRVYNGSQDATGTVMCRDHRDSYFTLNPGAHGAGEFGGACEPCRASQ